MRRRTRNIGQAVSALLTFTVILATSCGGITSCGGTTPIAGHFQGTVSGLNATIDLSTDGQSFFNALASDGIPPNISPMYFLKFDGSVTNNAVNLKADVGVGTLIVNWDAHGASGTVTYQGSSYDFNAPSVTDDPPIHAGVYLAEDVSYLAGWIVLPSQEQRGGIINKQTSTLKPVPVLTAQDIASGQVIVPGLGTFMLTPIQLGKRVPLQTTVTPPPVLSVSPGSFSLPGDKNCSFDKKAALWNCTATLTNSGRSDLKWSASCNLSGVTFNPCGGVLSAGQTTSVMISLPGYFCMDSTLIFSGPENRVTISVSCPPK